MHSVIWPMGLKPLLYYVFVGLPPALGHKKQNSLRWVHLKVI